MAISVFVVAAAVAAQAAHPQPAQKIDPAAARAEGYAEAQRALAAQDGLTPSSLAASLSVQQSAASAQRHGAMGVSSGSIAPAPSSAFDGLRIQAVPDAGANVRYYKGVATVDREDSSAAVQVTPMGMDHGRLTFAVSVLNLSQAPDNFGIENVSPTVGDQSVAVLSRQRLDHMASNRAHWKQFGMAMLGGLAAASEANSRDVYRATTRTPYGTYRTTITAPSIGGQIAAANTSAETGYALASIQARLDATREQLADEILQTTTVMPQDSYAARVVIEKFKGKLPQTVHLVMAFAGKQYPFDFLVAKDR